MDFDADKYERLRSDKTDTMDFAEIITETLAAAEKRGPVKLRTDTPKPSK